MAHPIVRRPNPRTSYSEDERNWRRQQEATDKEQREFFQELMTFPNLFSLMSIMKDLVTEQHAQNILERQEKELTEGNLQYHLEQIRCLNAAIFLLYFLGRRHQALERCESKEVQEMVGNKSIVFLTLKAALQWEFGDRHQGKETLQILHELCERLDYEYLCAVAESEKGYMLICIGPQGFISAMDYLQKAIDCCPHSDIFLWEYDLALAIRRNFNIHAYSQHSELSAGVLGAKALGLLQDITEHCPNSLYKAKGFIELARHVQHLWLFADVCSKDDKTELERLIANQNENTYIKKALEIKEGKEDHYVLRECGRFFMYKREFRKAIWFFQQAESKQKTSILYHLFGKLYLCMFGQKVPFIDPWEAVECDPVDTCFEVETGSHRPVVRQVPREPVCWLDCPPGQCPLLTSACEAQCLFEEFEETTYMDKDGVYRVTQPEGIGNILQHVSDSHTATESMDSVTASGNESDEVRRRLREYDDNLFVNEDGSFKTTQPGAVGNIVLPVPQTSWHGSSSFSSCVIQQEDIGVPRNITEEDKEARLYEEFDNTPYLNEDGTFKTSERGAVGGLIYPQKSWHERSASPRCENFKKSRSYPPTFTRDAEQTQPVIFRPYKPSIRKLLKARQPHPLDKDDTRVKTALTFLAESEKLNPFNASLLFDMGLLYEGTKELEKAIHMYKRIIGSRDSKSPLIVVTAYERCGLAYLERGHTCSDAREHEKLERRAEDMFMRSLVLCRRAVAHLPKVSESRASLWEGYTKLLQILHQSEGWEGNTRKLQREAEIHELVGKYLEAIEVYQKVMELAKTRCDRTGALTGCLRNYVSCGCVKDAKFMLDLILLSDQRDIILSSGNDEEMNILRNVAADVYSRAARQALGNGELMDARESFRTALLLMRRIEEHPPSFSLEADAPTLEYFDLCIFGEGDDDGNELPELSPVMSALARVFGRLFNLRVSVNSQEILCGRLPLTSELYLVNLTPLLVFVVAPGSRQLSPRMKYIREEALLSTKQVLVVTAGSHSQIGAGDPRTLPCDGFNSLPRYQGDELGVLTEDSKFAENIEMCCRLFEFILKSVS